LHFNIKDILEKILTYSAQVFRVLIASPSDVDEEREIAVRTIQEWNDLNSAERQLVLLPLRWETHSSPEYGKRPQEVINRQVVDHCDLVVGIFWTRIGSPTGIADSGTIEEIDRVAKNGKPVMLYFSRAKKDPENIDLDQLGKLREFKKNTYPRALVESYSGPIEFKDKLSKQIELQLRTLLVEQSKEQPSGQSEIRPVTDIVLSFAEDSSGKEIGNSQTIKTQYLDITGFENIPDYGVFSDEKGNGLRTTPSNKRSLGLLMESQINKNYYRELLTNLVIGQYFKPLRFSLKNLGGVGARDVYIDLSISSPNGKISFITKNQMPNGRPGISNFGLTTDNHPKHPFTLIGNASQGWTSQIEVPALQPQRKLSPETVFFIGAAESCEVIVTAKIFADTLASPVTQILNLKITVEVIESEAMDALKNIFITEKRPEEVISLDKILLEMANSDI
jgi:hypothetical protein